MNHSQWFQRYLQEQQAPKQVPLDKDELVKAEEPVVEAKPKAENKGLFRKADCALCQRKTWHFRGNALADKEHCCEHSDWSKDMRKPVSVNDAIAVVAQLSPTVERPTEGQIREQNRLNKALWRNASDRIARYYGDESDAEWLGRETPVGKDELPDPDKHFCTFCKMETPFIKLTTEKKPKIRRIQDEHLNADGSVEITERVMVTTETVHACPNCIVNIRKPIVVRRV